MNKKITSLVCLILSMSVLGSCAGTTGGQGETEGASAVSGTSVRETEPEYKFAELDMKGKTFKILNAEYASTMYNYLDVAELNGEALNDAIYNRNIYVEGLYNMKLVEDRVVVDTLNDEVKKNAYAGDNTYQTVYVRANTMNTIIFDNILRDLSEGSGFNFDEPWWDQAIMANAGIGEKKSIFFASSDFNLSAFEGTWCIYFNQSMMENLKLTTPYDHVRKGDWTFDTLNTYIDAGANQNGADSFAFKLDGACVYGFTSMSLFIDHSIVSSGERYITFIDGTPTFTAGTERFYNVCSKLAEVFGRPEAHFCNSRATGEHYELIFAAGRSLLVGGEVKGGRVFREMEDNYGIIPMPKLDEAQESYISPIFHWSFYLAVPVTNPDIETASQVLDTLSYLTCRDVVSEYYDINMKLKYTRNDDTMEMLDIIRGTRVFDIAYAFGWGSSLMGAVSSKLIKGEADVASLVAQNEAAIKNTLLKSLDTLTK